MIRHSASHLLAEDFGYLRDILERNFIGDGPLCADLRLLLARSLDCRHVVLTDSGASALLLALLGLRERYPRATQVITGAYVCPAVVSAIAQAGLQPRFVDTCADSLRIDFSAAAACIDAETLAIICTNTAGIPDDYAAAVALGVPVISDCAQAVGTRLDGHELASLGTCAILSFGATKMITAGRGGAFLSNDERLGQTVATLAQDELPVEEYRRRGFRATWGQHIGELTAGLAAAQIRRLASLVERRRQIAQLYDGTLRHHGGLTLVREDKATYLNRFRYYFLSESAADWISHLKALGIDAKRSISHLMAEYIGAEGIFPRLERTAGRLVSVPIFPAMTDAEVSQVVEALKLGLGQ